MTPVPPKRLGRPRLDAAARGPSADVHLTLSPAVYDKTESLAKQKRESIQDTIRRALTRLLDDERET
jgi:hypothetical protein